MGLVHTGSTGMGIVPPGRLVDMFSMGYWLTKELETESVDSALESIGSSNDSND